jgi:hypothetical protein
MHARGVPGAHVILRLEGRRPDDQAIQIAASYAAGHSGARTAAKVPVDVTARRNVRKIPGGPPGAVTYSGERTIEVEPRRLERSVLAARVVAQPANQDATGSTRVGSRRSSASSSRRRSRSSR